MVKTRGHMHSGEDEEIVMLRFSSIGSGSRCFFSSASCIRHPA
jgi:hypothetical protein